VVLQRDRETYAIAPHLPCGLVTPELLRKIADVAEKYHAAAIKCTSAERIAIVGLQEKDIDAAWADLGTAPGYMSGTVVRSVRACPGTDFCKRGRQNSLAMGLELDKRYAARPLPGKMKLGVSGCGNQCAETGIKDIGLWGGAHGWNILVGGAGGMNTRLGKVLLLEEVTDERALELVDKIIAFYAATAQEGERLGEMIDRVGLRALQHAVGVPATG